MVYDCIVPRAFHMGVIKLAKSHLKRIIGNAKKNYEELYFV